MAVEARPHPLEQSVRPHHPWGDPDTWAGWTHPRGERAWRLFLPLETVGAIPVPWPTDSSGQPASDTWWPTLSDMAGLGGDALGVFPASGRIEPVTLAHLVRSILRLPEEPYAVWRHVQDQDGPQHSDRWGPLSRLCRRWARGFAGRAWSLDSAIAIAAPAYADSVVVSGPARLGEWLATSGLQGAEVDRSDPVCIWSD